MVDLAGWALMMSALFVDVLLARQGLSTTFARWLLLIPFSLMEISSAN